MDAKPGAFENVVRQGDAAPPMPVDDYLAELDLLIAAHDAFKQDRVSPAIGSGTASPWTHRGTTILGAELRRRGRLPARPEPRPDEGRVLPPARAHRRRHPWLHPAARDDRDDEVHAYAEPEHGARAADVFRLVAVARSIQDRCRDAARNDLLVAEARVRAMNRWVE